MAGKEQKLRVAEELAAGQALVCAVHHRRQHAWAGLFGVSLQQLGHVGAQLLTSLMTQFGETLTLFGSCLRTQVEAVEGLLNPIMKAFLVLLGHAEDSADHAHG